MDDCITQAGESVTQKRSKNLIPFLKFLVYRKANFASNEAGEDDKSCKSQDSESRSDWQVLLVKLITGEVWDEYMYVGKENIASRKKIEVNDMHNPFLYILVSLFLLLVLFCTLLCVRFSSLPCTNFSTFHFSSFFQSTNCFLFDPHRQFAIIDNPSTYLTDPTMTKKNRDRLQSH